MKNKALDTKVKHYILDCIDASVYDMDPQTDAEKIQFLYDTFISIYGWTLERMDIQSALREWISGLPTAFKIEYRNHEILKLAYKWDSLSPSATEAQKDKILANWFNFIAAKTCQLFRKYKVEY